MPWSPRAFQTSGSLAVTRQEEAGHTYSCACFSASSLVFSYNYKEKGSQTIGGHRGTPTPHPQGILCPSCVVAGRALPPPLAWVSRWVQGPSTRARPLFLRGITWELGRAARTAGGGVTPYTTTPAPYIFFSSAKNPSVVLAQLKPVFQAHLQDFHIHSLHNSAHVPEALTPCHTRVSAPGHSCTVTRARMLPGTLGAPAAGMTAS